MTLTIPPEIIALAIKGGWNPWPYQWGKVPFLRINQLKTIAIFRNPISKGQIFLKLSEIFIDPYFWAGLGKAKKWDQPNAGWKDIKEEAHRCLDLILNKQDLKEFWENIINET